MDLSNIPFLHKTGDDSEADAPSSPLPPSRITKFRAFTNVLTYILAFWGTFSLLLQARRVIFPPIDVYRPSTLPRDDDLCACSPSSQDCIYDSLAAAFLPPRCRDDALTAKFESSFAPPYSLPILSSHEQIHDHGHNGTPQGMSWPYYLDANGTEAISVEEIAVMGANGMFWATREWHVAHCLWYWEKLVRMRETGVVMERRFAGVEHVWHCRRFAMKRDADWVKLIAVEVVVSSGFVGKEGG